MTATLDEGLAAIFSGDSAALQDPYPFYARLRSEAPVHRVGSSFFVSSHALVKAVYRDSRRFETCIRSADNTRMDGELRLLSDEELELYRELMAFERLYMNNKDGDPHLRIRAAGQRAFTPRRVAELGEVAERLAEELLDEVDREETADLMGFASDLPLLVIMEMLGAPRADSAQLKGWGDDVTAHFGHFPVPPEAVRRASRGLREYRAYVRELVEWHRPEGGRTPLFSALLRAVDDDQMTEDELAATVLLLLFAGHETTANLIGNGLLALLSEPARWALLCSDESLLPTAVEELLRYDSPSQLGSRRAVCDTELGGVEVPEGSVVLLLLGAANRDADVFADPDEVDLARRPNDHLALGHGLHFCLGGPLARLEGRLAFAAATRRYPALELAVDPASLRRTRPALRGLEKLPVRLNP